MPRPIQPRRRRVRHVKCASSTTHALAFRLQPTAKQCRSMLLEILRALQWDRHDTAATLGVSFMTLKSWIEGARTPTDAARKLIWMTWALLLHPELLRTVWHIVTWGRYAKFDPHCSVHPPSEPPLGHPTQQDGDDPGKLPS